MICPKCSYEQLSSDSNPLRQCPQCHEAYDKVLKPGAATVKRIAAQNAKIVKRQKKANRVGGFLQLGVGLLGLFGPLLLMHVMHLGFMLALSPLIALVLIFGGILELMTGRSLGEVSKAWDDLRGFRRVVFGILIVFLLFVGFACLGLILAFAGLG